MEKLNFEQFENAVNAAGIYNHEALINAVAEADLSFFSPEQLRLAAEVLMHVSN